MKEICNNPMTLNSIRIELLNKNLEIIYYEEIDIKLKRIFEDLIFDVLSFFLCL